MSSPMITPASDTVCATAPEVVLSGRSLVKSYGSSQALRGVSVELGRGEILAVTGPSGSGKSTLLLCLAGVLRPDSGEVRFAGRRIDGEGESARAALRRREFGVLFQFGQLVAEMTAAENVALPLLLGGRAGVRPRRQRADGSRASVSRSSPTSCRASCLAARASVSPLRGRLSPSPPCCSPTSRRARWTPWPAKR